MRFSKRMNELITLISLGEPCVSFRYEIYETFFELFSVDINLLIHLVFLSLNYYLLGVFLRRSRSQKRTAYQMWFATAAFISFTSLGLCVALFIRTFQWLDLLVDKPKWLHITGLLNMIPHNELMPIGHGPARRGLGSALHISSLISPHFSLFSI